MTDMMTDTTIMTATTTKRRVRRAIGLVSIGCHL